MHSLTGLLLRTSQGCNKGAVQAPFSSGDPEYSKLTGCWQNSVSCGCRAGDSQRSPSDGLRWWGKVMGLHFSRLTPASPYISTNSHVKVFDSL